MAGFDDPFRLLELAEQHDVAVLCGFIENGSNDRVAVVAPPALLAWTVNVDVPGALGTPLTTPLPANAMPAGSTPRVTTAAA